jgi:hypothetical protein
LFTPEQRILLRMQDKFVIHSSSSSDSIKKKKKLFQYDGFQNMNEKLNHIFKPNTLPSWKLVVLMGAMQRHLEQITKNKEISPLDRKLLTLFT